MYASAVTRAPIQLVDIFYFLLLFNFVLFLLFIFSFIDGSSYNFIMIGIVVFVVAADKWKIVAKHE